MRRNVFKLVLSALFHYIYTIVTGCLSSLFGLKTKTTSERKQEIFKEKVCRYSLCAFQSNPELNLQCPTTNLKRKIYLGVEFVERRITTKFGLLTKVSGEEDMVNACTSLENIFDTSVAIEVMTSSGIRLSDIILETVKLMLLQNKSTEGGWNFFGQRYTLLPNDLDDSCCVALALLSCGVSTSKVQEMAQEFLSRVYVHGDGLVDVYFESPNGRDPSNHIINDWEKTKRVDLVVTANFLYLLNKLKLEHANSFETCYIFIQNVLQAFIKNGYKDALVEKHLKNYTCINIVCFFISRLVSVSAKAEKLYKGRIEEILRSEMNRSQNTPLALACQIMASINIGMAKNKIFQKQISCQVQKLLTLQNQKDFGFDICAFYNAHKKLFFGSRAVSTFFSVSALSLYSNHQNAYYAEKNV